MQSEATTQSLITYGKQMFYMTLAGKVYKFLKKHSEASTSTLIQYLQRKELLHSSGKTYMLNGEPAVRQALLGAATSSMFTIIKDTWRLNSQRAKECKRLKIRKHYNRSIRAKHSLPLLTDHPKLFKKIRLLQKLTTELKSNNSTAKALKNPFKKLEGTEDLVKAAQIIGKDQFLGMIEGFLITTKYCKV